MVTNLGVDANGVEKFVYTPITDDKDLTIAALMESNELLGELLSRYRRSNTLLRRINSDLRRLKNIQASNDEEFRSMCQGDIYIEVDVQSGEDGLSDPQVS